MNKQAFGNIIKKELLESFSGFANNDSMLLIASNPFPGFDGKEEKNYYYLVLDSKIQISKDELIRLTQNITKALGIHLDICPSDITVYNKLYRALRIHCHNLDNIHDLITQFKLYGISFQKNQLVKPYISKIKVIKFFELAEVNEGIYKSLSTPEFKYIQISGKIEWEDFEYLVAQANKEEPYSNCDFAMASFYSKSGFDDYIRVFSDNCTLDKLQSFKEFILGTLQQHSIK